MRRLVPSEEDCWIIKDALTKIIQTYQSSFVYQVWKYLNCVTVPSHDKKQGTTVYEWSLRSLGGPQIHPPSHVTYHAAHARSTREHQDEDIDPWWMMEPRKTTQAIFETRFFASNWKGNSLTFNPNLHDFCFQILASFLSHNNLRSGEVMIPRGNHMMHKNSPIKTSYKRWLIKLNDLEKRDTLRIFGTSYRLPSRLNEVQAQPDLKPATFQPSFFDSSNFQMHTSPPRHHKGF